MYVLLAHLVAPKLRKVQRVRALRVCNVLARVAMSSLTTCDVVAHMNALLDHSHLTAEDDAHSVPNDTCENIYRCACVCVYTGCSVLLSICSRTQVCRAANEKKIHANILKLTHSNG